MSIPPLNGTKTRPLSPHALDVLRMLLNGATPRQEINAGVINRLQRESLIETIGRQSPYKTHRGRLIDFVEITEAGRAVLAREP
jgi:hypothetical protein